MKFFALVALLGAAVHAQDPAELMNRLNALNMEVLDAAAKGDMERVLALQSEIEAISSELGLDAGSIGTGGDMMEWTGEVPTDW